MPICFLPPRSQKFLDGPQDGIAIRYPAGDHVFLFAYEFVDVLEKLARAVWALHLAVAEQVELGEAFLVEQLDAVRRMVPQVVAVGELEGVLVCLVRRVAYGGYLVA